MGGTFIGDIMSKELKPYERENELLKEIRQKKEHQHRRRIEITAIERGLKRLHATYEHDKKAYAVSLESRRASIDNVERQIMALTTEMKNLLPKPKAKLKPELLTPKNNKEVCEVCLKEFSKKGIKAHRKACLKKVELARLRDELEKLEIEETLDELEQGDATKVEIEAIVDEIDEEIEDIKDGD